MWHCAHAADNELWRLLPRGTAERAESGSGGGAGQGLLFLFISRMLLGVHELQTREDSGFVEPWLRKRIQITNTKW